LWPPPITIASYFESDGMQLSILSRWNGQHLWCKRLPGF